MTTFEIIIAIYMGLDLLATLIVLFIISKRRYFKRLGNAIERIEKTIPNEDEDYDEYIEDLTDSVN